MKLVASGVRVAGGEVGGLDPAVHPVGGVSRERYGAGHRGGRGVGL
jgi:hypothetical protein